MMTSMIPRPNPFNHSTFFSKNAIASQVFLLFLSDGILKISGRAAA